MFGGKEKSRTFASAIEKQTSNSKCPDGGIGRRAGLKHQWIHFHPGSTPGLGTEREVRENFSFFLFLFECALESWVLVLS